jgi:metal-responsive CopG/Arc/MetJ family transcriptional regulator
MASEKRGARIFTVRFPPDLARQVERAAKQESRNISELFREAFRSYRLRRVQARLRRDIAYARTRNPKSYTEADVESFVDEIRGAIHAAKSLRK